MSAAAAAAHPAERRSFFDGTNGSSGIDHRRGEQHYHRAGHRPRSPRVPSSASPSSKSHWRRDEEIREIFSLIDKVLGGCEDAAEVEARIEELLLRSAGSDGRYFRPPTFSTFRPNGPDKPPAARPPQAAPTPAATNNGLSARSENGGGGRHRGLHNQYGQHRTVGLGEG